MPIAKLTQIERVSRVQQFTFLRLEPHQIDQAGHLPNSKGASRDLRDISSYRIFLITYWMGALMQPSILISLKLWCLSLTSKRAGRKLSHLLTRGSHLIESTKMVIFQRSLVADQNHSIKKVLWVCCTFLNEICFSSDLNTWSPLLD